MSASPSSPSSAPNLAATAPQATTTTTPPSVPAPPLRPLTTSDAQSIMAGGSTLTSLLDNPDRLLPSSAAARKAIFSALFHVVGDSRSVFTSGVRHDSADAMALLTTVLNPRGQFARGPIAAELAMHIGSMGLSGLKRLRLERHILSSKDGVAPGAVAFITALSLAAAEITPAALLGGNTEAEQKFAGLSSSFARGASRGDTITRHANDGTDPNDPLLRGPAGTRRSGNRDVRIGAAATANNNRTARRYSYLPSQPSGNASTSANPAYVRGQTEVQIDLAQCMSPAAVRMHARAFGLGGRSAIPKLSAGADMAKRKCLVLKLIFPPAQQQQQQLLASPLAAAILPPASSSPSSSTSRPASPTVVVDPQLVAVAAAAAAASEESPTPLPLPSATTTPPPGMRQRTTSMMVVRGGEDVPAPSAEEDAAVAAAISESGGDGGSARYTRLRRRHDRQEHRRRGRAAADAAVPDGEHANDDDDEEEDDDSYDTDEAEGRTSFDAEEEEYDDSSSYSSYSTTTDSSSTTQDDADQDNQPSSEERRAAAAAGGRVEPVRRIAPLPAVVAEQRAEQEQRRRHHHHHHHDPERRRDDDSQPRGGERQQPRRKPNTSSSSSASILSQNILRDPELAAAAAERVVTGNAPVAIVALPKPAAVESKKSSNNDDDDDDQQQQPRQQSSLPTVASETALNSFPRFVQREEDDEKVVGAAAAAASSGARANHSPSDAPISVVSPPTTSSNDAKEQQQQQQQQQKQPPSPTFSLLSDKLLQTRSVAAAAAAAEPSSSASQIVEAGPAAIGLMWWNNSNGKRHSSSECLSSVTPLLRRGASVPTYRLLLGQSHATFLVGTGEIPATATSATSTPSSTSSNSSSSSSVLMLATSGTNECSQCSGPPSSALPSQQQQQTMRNFVAIGSGGRGASIAQLCCGSFFTACVTTTGEMYLWGDNSHGQCSVGSSLQKRGPVQQQPNKILFRGNRVLRIACGATFVVALTEGDRVLGWGSVVMLGAGAGAADAVPCEAALGSGHLLRAGLISVNSSSSSSSVSSTAEQHAREQEQELELHEAISSCATVPCSVASLCGKGIHTIAAGPFHCLAVAKPTGYVYAWGFSGNGRLGIGSTSSNTSSSIVTTPKRIDPKFFASLKVDSVACGTRHSAAVSVGGAALWLWGDNTCGQCGVAVPDGTGNDVGGAGGGSSSAECSSILTPQRVFIPKPQRVSIVEVSCGEDRTCVLFGDGDILTWGRLPAVAGGCGFANGAPVSVRTVFGVPQQLAPHVAAVSVACGAGHLGALGARRDLGVLTLGVVPPGTAALSLNGNTNNNNGQQQQQQQQILFGARLEKIDSFLGGDGGMLSVAAGGSHSVIGLVSTSNTDNNNNNSSSSVSGSSPKILTFGSGDWGQLGGGGAATQQQQPMAPTTPESPVTPSATPTGMSGGGGGGNKRIDPAPIASFFGSSSSSSHLTLRSISSGHAFCFAIFNNSKDSCTDVYFWGNNNHCQSCIAPDKSNTTGSSLTNKFEVPVRVAALSGGGNRKRGGSNIVQIACGSFFAMALADDGRVYSWGLFDSCGLGALGDFDAAQAVAKGRVLFGEDDDDDKNKISSILTKSLTKESRAVVAYPVRIDDYPITAGILSDDDDDDDGNQKPPPCFIVRIAAGPWHAAVLSDRGQVFVFGVGTNHRLGMGADDTRSHLKPVRVDIGTRIRDVACGHANTLAISAQDSSLFVWGDNEFGQCPSAAAAAGNNKKNRHSGDGGGGENGAAATSSSVPEPLCVIPGGVKSAAVTRSCTIAVMWNGSVLLCGTISPSAAQTQLLAQQQQQQQKSQLPLLSPIASKGKFVSLQAAGASVRRATRQQQQQQQQQQQDPQAAAEEEQQPSSSSTAADVGKILSLGHPFLSLFPVPPLTSGLLDDDDDDDDGAAEKEDDKKTVSAAAAAQGEQGRMRSLFAHDVVASTQHAMLVVEMNRPSTAEWCAAHNAGMSPSSSFVAAAIQSPVVTKSSKVVGAASRGIIDDADV